MEKNNHIRVLFDKYLENRITEEELKDLLSYFEVDDDKVILTKLINEELAREPENEIEPGLIDEIDARLQRKIFSSTRPVSKIRKLLPAISVAATILLGLSFISIMYIMRAKKEDSSKQMQYANDVKPGSSKAILTLANGNTINLSNAKNGNIAHQSGVSISKTAAGQVIYSGNAAISNSQFNTIETPKGGEYQVVLPDGTKVWLNAASSLKYPVAFAGLKERKVELTGEAYFEVAHNKAQPFKVTTNGQSIEVLGTHFDVMAYSNEATMNTTLLQGSVRIRFKGKNSVIKPGEAAIVKDDIAVKDADVDAAVAWKNGRTYFKNTDIPAMMRTLSRWYNIEVEYRGAIPQRKFTGGISRNSNLSGLLKIMDEIEVHTSIEGNKLIVRP